jgi:L-alanine-DL-glutamate epimerase-like enolase superfamily enzyme
MKIMKIEAIPFRLPLRADVGPVKSSIWSMSAAEHVLIKVTTDEGIVGYGEAPQRPTIYGETQKSIVAIVDSWLGPSLIGMDPFDLEKVWSQMGKVVANNTAKGAIDMAIHDILGKRLGLSVHKLLGGWADGKVAAASLISMDTPEKMAKAAAGWMNRQGIKAFKIKVGTDPEKDIRAFVAIREAVGDDATLYVDANQAWSPEVAIRMIKAMEPHGLAWVEEPVKKWDFEGKERVARSIGVPLLLDESIFTPQEALHHVKMRIAGMISIKTVRTGFHESRKIVHLAEAANVPCLVGTARETAVGAVANAQMAAGFKNILFGELTEFTTFEDTFLKSSLKIENGFFHLPPGPGLGVEIDEKRFSKYRLSL